VISELDGPVAVLTLQRPDQLNALDGAVLDELDRALDRIDADSAQRVVVVTGAGRAFSAGADIAMMQRFEATSDFRAYLRRIGAVFDRLEALDRPTVAAIGGIAFGGGCELALCCDLRIMARNASLGVPEIRIGVLPGAGGTQRLPRLLPDAVAKQLLYTGDPLSAEDALRHGVVNEVVEPGEALPAALRWAHRLAELPPRALSGAKALVTASHATALAQGLELERRVVAELYDSEDRVEGMGAFLEKRPARFTGR
jgi:enoyl-CoA hydratase